MKMLVLLALVVCAVAAMPYVEDEKELARRMFIDLSGDVHRYLDAVMSLVSHDTTEHACEVACKAGIHHLVPLPLVEHMCAPACKELQRLGKIHG